MASASNQIGTFHLIRQVKPRSRWGASTTPVFDPNWVVEFKLPGAKPVRESSRLPICRLCLATIESPVKARPGCRVENCQTDVARWAEVRLAELAGDWKADRLRPVRGEEPKRLNLKEVYDLYDKTGPGDRAKNLSALKMVTCEVLGRDWQDVHVDELKPEHWDRFAWMYQEADRRGWLRRNGKKPKDAWAQLRALCPDEPVPDRKSVTSANTTIRSSMRKAKAVLGQLSQDNYLKPLRHRMPTASLDRWLRTKVALRTPDTRFSLSQDVYAKMWEELPKLRQRDVQAWGLLRLHWTTAVRPKEAFAVRKHWLEVDDAGQVLLVIKNRPEEGFYLKDATTKQERVWPLPADLVEELPRLITEKGAFLADLPGQLDKIYRRANTWLRACGVEGQHTLYHLRKLVATVKTQKEGLDAARSALGHAPGSAVTGDFYASDIKPITPLADADLTPEAVMGPRRKAWGGSGVDNRGL